ncbi:DNA-binding transcriptional regulator, MarR family [Paracoccus halophilus]|uniref:DNA-binding transcriptional regulator, MarR family n=1 Tax=Paracoccus halophilus TaxID=376733 RepID=A0A099F6C5_9RHOB|nr:MarR family transcriptional regulator [Paracoccus halophilus]KGJ05984.1 MarR family transcriptional regulator [Paracoccus halophilus]SFA54020.1 DNA-binding transcriptional regulator, MarR family [Paracoccus halophilus]
MDRIDTCLIALRRILRAAETYGKELAQSAGMTPVQLRVVQIVAETGSSTAGAIARRMHVAPATITAIIDKLERAGHVSREQSRTDRRQTHIVLTERGRNALDRAPDALQQKFATDFEGLEDWEQAMIVAVLERVASMLDRTETQRGAVLYPGEL